MWRDYPFSQRSKTTERAMEWGMELIGKRRAGQNSEKIYVIVIFVLPSGFSLIILLFAPSFVTLSTYSNSHL